MEEDKNTTIEELKNLLKEFRDEREWKEFHDPKNLAEAISIEAGELQEMFLWKDKQHIIDKIKNDNGFKEEVGEELADVIIFCLNFANVTDLDVSSIVQDKIKKNREKYSVNKAKGNAIKYNKL
jgi:dCTP diphosphatase